MDFLIKNIKKLQSENTESPYDSFHQEKFINEQSTEWVQFSVYC